MNHIFFIELRERHSHYCQMFLQGPKEQGAKIKIFMYYKGASKMRRDMINGEIANLRDLLPLPSSTRQRLSQLQLMALVCVYVRKSNYFNEGIYSL